MDTDRPSTRQDQIPQTCQISAKTSDWFNNHIVWVNWTNHVGQDSAWMHLSIPRNTLPTNEVPEYILLKRNIDNDNEAIIGL